MTYAQLQIQNALMPNQSQSQYEYSIDGNKVPQQSQGSVTNQLIQNGKINPMSGGIPISTILPQRSNNSELTSYQSEKKLRGFNNNQAQF
jgi:hypothetical protein